MDDLKTFRPIAEIKTIKFNCPKHGLVEGKATTIGSEYIEICPFCEQEETDKELQEQEKKELEKRKAFFEAKMHSCNIEPEYWHKTIDDYIPSCTSQQIAKDAVKEMIAKKCGKVILLGSNGVGKTMLGSIAVAELGGKIMSMYEITTMIRACYTARAEKTELELVKELASLPMLVIDELGRTKGSEAELNWLSYILDKRHVRNLPFMILSNTHLRRMCKKDGCPNCFENYVNNDVLSRLRENAKIVSIEAADYRANKGDYKK